MKLYEVIDGDASRVLVTNDAAKALYLYVKLQRKGQREAFIDIIEVE